MREGCHTRFTTGYVEGNFYGDVAKTFHYGPDLRLRGVARYVSQNDDDNEAIRCRRIGAYTRAPYFVSIHVQYRLLNQYPPRILS
jgi:hypothetical protein